VDSAYSRILHALVSIEIYAFNTDAVGKLQRNVQAEQTLGHHGFEFEAFV